MHPGRRGWHAAAAATALLLGPASPLAAQAFTAPKGVGAISLAWQYIDNTGHRLTDGTLVKRGESASASLALDVEYAVTDRFSATLGIPYVSAKYTGALPPPSNLPVDVCQCWHSGFADFSLGARYRFGGETWAVTPTVRLGQPSHSYPYQGEAVLGKQLSEAQLGVLAGLRLADLLPKATVQAGYLYAVVEKPVDTVSVNRSSVFVDLGYAATRKLYVRTAWLLQYTHGGLRFGSPTGNPFFPPGELNTPALFAERDRLLKVRYMQLAAGLSYSLGRVDVFASYSNYVWGRDAHDGQAFTAGASFYFGLPE
jgi:hypothetical protein